MKLGLKISQSKNGKNKTRGENDRGWRGWLRRSRLVKFLPFLILAFVIWIQQTLQYDLTRSVYIPLGTTSVSLSLGTRSQVPDVLEVQVRDRGLEHIRYGWKGFDTIQLSTLVEKNGSKYIGLLRKELSEAVKAKLSPTATIVQMSLNEIKVPIYERMMKRVPVVFASKPRTADGYTIERITIRPDSVVLYADASRISSIHSVATIAWGDSVLSETRERSLPLRLGKDLYSEVKSVKVRLELGQLTERTYTLPIRVVNAPQGYSLTLLPSMVAVQLTLPQSRYKDLKEDDLELTADYDTRDEQAGELHLTLTKRPSYVVQAHLSPERVEFVKERLP